MFWEPALSAIYIQGTVIWAIITVSKLFANLYNSLLASHFLIPEWSRRHLIRETNADKWWRVGHMASLGKGKFTRIIEFKGTDLCNYTVIISLSFYQIFLKHHCRFYIKTILIREKSEKKKWMHISNRAFQRKELKTWKHRNILLREQMCRYCAKDCQLHYSNLVLKTCSENNICTKLMYYEIFNES